MTDVGHIAQVATGATQSGIRAHNERLLMSLIRMHGALPGSELSRLTGLSPQTVSVILRSLEADGLILRGEPQRGRVGKPSIPVALNPDGAVSFGLKIGRRSADLAVMDLTGTIRRQTSLRYPYPRPGDVIGFLKDGIDEIRGTLPGDTTVCGIGIAAPFDLEKWDQTTGSEPSEFAAWADTDVTQELKDFDDWPVVAVNDATAACHAETIFGAGADLSNYAYFFMGTFIGGGIVLNGSVHEGRFGNAGALGSLPAMGEDGHLVQLLDVASLHLLESRLRATGGDPERLYDGSDDWTFAETELTPWIKAAGRQLARAGLAAAAVIDFEAVVIDGAMPPRVRAALVRRVREEMALLDTRGLVRPRVVEGTVGGNARVIGAAHLPIAAQFFNASA